MRAAPLRHARARIWLLALGALACGSRTGIDDDFRRGVSLLDAATTESGGASESGGPEASIGGDAALDGPATTSTPCAPGYAATLAGCTALGVRLVAPLSTATVTSDKPILHWELSGGADGAQVDVCGDRACTRVLRTVAAKGTTTQLDPALAPGVYFWRALPSAGGAVAAALAASPVWEFFVGHGAFRTQTNTSWGSTLDVNGDGLADVIVGAPSRNGNAYVYFGASSGVTAPPAVLPDPLTPLVGGGGNLGFGTSVASAGDVNGDGYADVIVGAPGGGSAYVFLGGSPVFRGAPQVLVGTAGAGSFGSSVAGAGDVNGDGYADVVVGAANGSMPYAFLFLGSASGLSTTSILLGPVAAPSEGFTTVVSAAGDVNADGFADVIVAGTGVGPSQADVFFGGPSIAGPVPPAMILQLAAAGPVDPAGPLAVANAGDVNSDGYSDVLVGVPSGSAALLFFGGPGTVSPMTTVLQQPFAVSLGASVAGAGDIDGDGFDDVVVGASQPADAFVYFGGPNGTSPPVAIDAPPMSSQFGFSLSGAGDVNGDGFDDMVVGESDSQMGTAYVYEGSSPRSTLFVTPTVLDSTGGFGDEFGYSVAQVDDLARDRPAWWAIGLP
jgi:hypothetical protein